MFIDSTLYRFIHGSIGMIRLFVIITFTLIVFRARIIAAYRALIIIRSNIMSIVCTPINNMSIRV